MAARRRDDALTGIDGLRAVLGELDGFELPARAWERYVLPARLDRYEPSMLDMLCLTGEVGWARLSAGPIQVAGVSPIALFLREHADAWLALREDDEPSRLASDRATLQRRRPSSSPRRSARRARDARRVVLARDRRRPAALTM